MDNVAIERLLKISRNIFYTDFYLFICQLTALITAIFFNKKQKFGIHFLLYCIAALLLQIGTNARFFIFLNKESTVFYTEGQNVFFAIVEYTVFGIYFLKLLRSAATKKSIRIFSIVILLAALFFFYKGFFTVVSDIQILRMADFITSTELLFLAILCLLYYIELFREMLVYNLLQSSAFWIVTSLFFYCIIIIPFFLIMTDEFMESHLLIFSSFFAVHFLSFGLLFIAITRAFLCKKPLTT